MCVGVLVKRVYKLIIFGDTNHFSTNLFEINFQNKILLIKNSRLQL